MKSAICFPTPYYVSVKLHLHSGTPAHEFRCNGVPPTLVKTNIDAKRCYNVVLYLMRKHPCPAWRDIGILLIQQTLPIALTWKLWKAQQMTLHIFRTSFLDSGGTAMDSIYISISKRATKSYRKNKARTHVKSKRLGVMLHCSGCGRILFLIVGIVSIV